ncbi:MAG TPA: hypothetical protein VE957_05545 [Terriglobales bacterium]|nr:hypothetical protein [Terriglobales bacterium]
MLAEDCGAMVSARGAIRQSLHFPHYKLCQPNLAVLQRVAKTRSDTEAAQRMQQAKRKLFDELRLPANGPWK